MSSPTCSSKEDCLICGGHFDIYLSFLQYTRYGILVNPIQWGEYSINSETIPTWVCLLGKWVGEVLTRTIHLGNLG